MSARGALAMDLLNAGLAREHVDRRTRDFRDEVLREAAEKLRKQRHDRHDQIKCVPCFMYGHVADLIDPDKES